MMAETGAEQALAATLHRLEDRLDARIGVQILDSGSGWRWGYREDERFLMANTFKPLLCAAVLDQADKGTLTLDERLPVRPGGILAYAPVTSRYAGSSLSLSKLCQATLDLSDNMAANLLLRRIGGPGAVTAYLRQTGDSVTRLDRYEPELNLFVRGDPRDSTTPSAMAAALQKILLGNGLSAKSRDLLVSWMETGSVTKDLIRPSLPQGWHIADKSGGGQHHTRNIVAMITPPGRPPWIVAVFISDTGATWQLRNQALITIGAALTGVLTAR